MMDSREGKDTTRSFRVYKDGRRVEKKLRKMKNLKCDYGWVQEGSNETDVDE